MLDKKGIRMLKGDIILEPQRLTSATVKVRRLGYLASIPSIIQDREIPAKLLYNEVHEWAIKNRRFFEHYSLSLPVIRAKRRRLTGEITTSNAAGRYVKTCKELGLIVKVRGFRASKIGKAISFMPTTGNPFELSLSKCFTILRSLLEKDYDSLYVLTRILNNKEESKIEFFRKEIQKRLHTKMEMATQMNKMYLVDALRSRLEILRNWKEPHRYYLENIEAPRLEWMLDLRLLSHWNQRTGTTDLKENVNRLFQEEIISYRWLYDEFPRIFAGIYSEFFKKGIIYWTDLGTTDKADLLDRLLDHSMKMFETGSAIGKISADAFFEYALGVLVQTESIIAPLSDFETDLVSFVRSGKLNYRYVQAVSPADKGYITRN